MCLKNINSPLIFVLSTFSGFDRQKVAKRKFLCSNVQSVKVLSTKISGLLMFSKHMCLDILTRVCHKHFYSYLPSCWLRSACFWKWKDKNNERKSGLSRQLPCLFCYSDETETFWRGRDCKYRESLARLKKSKVLMICLENPFREICSKKLFQSLKIQMCPRKWGKTKIWFFYLINYAKNTVKLTNFSVLVVKEDDS